MFSNLTFIFEILKLSITFNQIKYINCVARHSLSTKIIKKPQLILQNGARCCMQPCAVKLTTDSYPFSVAH